MKNLKRALSFAVAAIMLVGLMAVGTSAFTDDADIENTEAVNIMNQLGIILGKPDGSFDPTATVSRAEMAKMICVALNGGKDPKLESEGTLYPDTKGNWAAGYIDYCTNLGIVAGSTDGNFYPGNPVTGTEAAKMILIALGYDAKNEKFVNDANWSLNINIRANQKDLYDELTILPGAPLSRDNAAQMIFNGMDAEMVEYDYQLNTVDGNLVSIAVAKDQAGKTIMGEKFNLNYFTATLTDATYDEDEDEYTYTYAAAQDENGAAYTPVSAQKKNSADFSDLFMQQVKVLYKNDSTKKMYGMYAVDSTVLAEATVADVDLSSYNGTDKTIEVDGTEIELNDDATGGAAVGNAIPVYNNLTATNSALSTYAAVAANAPFAIKFIDNTGDDKADLAVVYPYATAQVTYVGKTTITAGAPYSFEDDTIYEGVAKDDYVVITPAANTTDGKNVVAKMDVVTGTVEGLKSNNTGVKVNGEWYTLHSSASAVSLNTKYDLYVVNGYIYYSEAVEDVLTAEDMVLVLNADGATTSVGVTTQKAKVVFSDGTSKVVTIDKLNDNDIGGGNVVANGTLYTFEVKNDNYRLTAIDPADYDNVQGGVTLIDEGKVTTGSGTYRVNSNAVIWVIYDTPAKAKVVSGADVNKWENETISSGTLYAEDKDGFKYAQVGVLTVAGSSVPGAAGDTCYGLVTAPSVKVKVGDDYFAQMTIWNGTETVTVSEEVSSGTPMTGVYAKGALISYDDLGDGKIDNVAFIGGNADAVTAYDGTWVEFAGNPGNEYEIDEDTVIIYIDSAKKVGYEGGEIVLYQDDNGVVNNVYVYSADASALTVLFVDVNNKWDL